MRITILIGAALLSTAGIAATPADAQRYGGYDRGDDGWRGDRGGDRWQGDRGWRDDRHWRNDRRWQGDRGYGWNRGPRWRGGYARSRVVCRVQRSYYGPVRRCFNVYR